MWLFYRILFLSSLILTIVSCTEKSGVTIRGEMSVVAAVGHSIKDIDENIWKVGPLGKQRVSKGFRVEISLPVLSIGHMQDIYKKHNMDSWILKAKQRSSYRGQVIGYMYFPLLSPGQDKGSNLRVTQLKRGIFSINFSAAAVSTRLRTLPCPAFKHEFRIDKLNVVSEKPSGENIFISSTQAKRVVSKVERFTTRIILNGGASLRGDYMFELAAYNSRTKMRLSNWINIAGRAVVGSEIKKSIKGCENFKVPPAREGRSHPAARFKFGR